MKSRKFALISVATLAVIAAITIMRPTRPRLSAPEAATSPVEPAPRVKRVAAKTLKAGPIPADHIVAQQEAAIGLMPLAAAAPSENGTDLRVLLSIKPSCDWGDWDVIRMELHYAQSDRLLLSVEPLDPDDRSFAPVMVRLDRGAVEDGGFSHTFHIPPVTQLVPLGVFVCLDKRGEGRCASKKAEDINQTYGRLKRIVRADRGAPKIEDKIYFFQYFQAQPMALKVLSSSQLDEQRYRMMGDYLATQLGASARAAAAIERLKVLNGALASIPLTDGTQEVVIELPWEKPAACKVAKAPVQGYPTSGPQMFRPGDPRAPPALKGVWQAPPDALRPPSGMPTPATGNSQFKLDEPPAGG